MATEMSARFRFRFWPIVLGFAIAGAIVHRTVPTVPFTTRYDQAQFAFLEGSCYFAALFAMFIAIVIPSSLTLPWRLIGALAWLVGAFTAFIAFAQSMPD
jgi:hypothetical protein